MKYPFQLEQHPESNFEIETNFWTGKVKVHQDGTPLDRLTDKPGKPFEVKQKFRDSTLIYIKNIFPDPAPKMTVEDKRVHYVKPLQWYDYIICTVPVVLIFVGGLIGGIIGAGTTLLNFTIIRSERSAVTRYMLVLLSSVVMISVALLISYIIVEQWKGK